MKSHQAQFLSTAPLTSIHSTRLDTRTFYRPQSNSNNNLDSSFTRKNLDQRFTTIKIQETLPRYQTSSIYFDKIFARQTIYSRRSRWIRQAFATIIIIIGFIGLYLIYTLLTCSTNLTNHFLISPRANIKGQILLYRILGNDLPPRHKPGQTLKNLRFILEHESEFLNTKKWWILNRIANPEYEIAIINLLKFYNQNYIIIPFDDQEYLKYDFRLEDFPEPDFFHSNEFRNFSKVHKLKTIDYIYYEKNLYAINNVTLAHGKSQHNVSWILPFDGNCFLTPNAFADIRSHLNKWGDQYKYFIVPMARLINNSRLLDGPDTRPITPEEPQIIFRYDSDKTFNETMRYGRRSKLEMLWRLGVPSTSKSSDRSSYPWEFHDSYKSKSVHYKKIGWVFRLFSGQASQELNKKEAGSLRAYNRLLAVQELIDSIDERIARKIQGFDPLRLLLYDENLLSQARFNFWLEVPDVVEIVQVLIKRADEILSTTINLFESIHDDQEDENTRVNFMKIKKSSLHRPVELITPDSFFENVTTLALAHYFSNDEKYAIWAANLIRTFILSSYAIENRDDFDVTTSHNSDFDSDNVEGYDFPNTNKLPRIIPRIFNSDSLFSTNITDSDPSFFLDACRLLYRTNIFTHKEYINLRMFAFDWLDILINSKITRKPDHRSIMLDLRILSLAGFVDDLRLYLRIVNRVRMRIGNQFHISSNSSTQEIKQNYEIMFVQNLLNTSKIKSSDYDENIFHYTSLNLQYWLLLIRAVQNGRCGPDIWQYTAKDGQKISRATMEHLKLYANKMHDISLIHIAKTAYMINKSKRCTWKEPKEEIEYFQNLTNIDIDNMNVIFGNRSDDKELNTRIGLGNEARRRGLPPFWMLGVA
ncbi:9268_t:CDS:2 [Dentiscutata erythropus]|uniref:9268_t:CDS:1 n=1 Tax=Dentiscutata erythropus TaxID=1348616 RepID=A0A9N9F0Y5_9GLOM|nr:9268_t:CDS:2 [Dentiscutata erythropus]